MDPDIDISTPGDRGTPSLPRLARLMNLLTALLALLAVVAAMGALWLALNLHNGRLNGWMSIVVAFDALLLLRLAGSGRGRIAAAGCLLATLICTAGSVWLTAGVRLGRVMGLSALDSLARMDPLLALEVARQSATWTDLGSMLAAAGLCLLGTRRQPAGKR